MILILFLFGLAIGSFLNVLIDRLPRDESFVKGRSYCDNCKKRLLWYDLIPLLSFIVLKGKCRHCQSPISFYYPTVELLTGIVFVLVFLFLPHENIKYQISSIKYAIELFYYLYITSSLIVVFFADLKYGIIPDKIVYPAILVSLVFLISPPSGEAGQHPNILISSLLSALGAFLFFLLLFLITKGRGMGFGDVKLVFLLGIFLGWPKIIVAFYVAFLTGAAVGCILILWRKKKLKGATIPFGPFLVAGAFISFFWGDYLLLKIMQVLHW